MLENIEQKITKIEVKSKEQLDELYNCSALTFLGLLADEESIKGLVNWLKKYSEISNPLPIYIISGKTMNINYKLTGTNKYKDDLSIISIKNDDIKNLSAIVIPRFELGGRWFDDIVNNNASREKLKLQEKIKPKCALLGEDGNIFNLMGVASKTLKQNNMNQEAKEMCDRITSSKNYYEALSIIGEYVEITDQAGLEDAEEFD